jgi:pimeloyl-ACP methyl ester carboxylesterase
MQPDEHACNEVARMQPSAQILLHAKVLGQRGAPAVLFLSGFVGSGEVWDVHFQALGNRFRLLMLDTLGFGKSPKPDIEYSLTEHLDAIDRTLDHYAVERADIVGHSMGCLLALAYAERFPQKVRRLVLLACPAFDDEQQARHSIANVSRFNRWLATDTPLARWACALMCTLRPVLLPLAPYLVRDVPAAVARDALQHHWKSYSRTLRNVIFQADTQRRIRQIDKPLLFIHGAQDETAPYANILRFAKRSNVRIVTLTAGHGLIFTHGELIAQEVASFLASSDTTAA